MISARVVREPTFDGSATWGVAPPRKRRAVAPTKKQGQKLGKPELSVDEYKKNTTKNIMKDFFLAKSNPMDSTNAGASRKNLKNVKFHCLNEPLQTWNLSKLYKDINKIIDSYDTSWVKKEKNLKVRFSNWKKLDWSANGQWKMFYELPIKIHLRICKSYLVRDLVLKILRCNKLFVWVKENSKTKSKFCPHLIHWRRVDASSAVRVKKKERRLRTSRQQWRAAFEIIEF